MQAPFPLVDRESGWCICYQLKDPCPVDGGKCNKLEWLEKAKKMDLDNY